MMARSTKLLLVTTTGSLK